MLLLVCKNISRFQISNSYQVTVSLSDDEIYRAFTVVIQFDPAADQLCLIYE